ncbi:MAG: hypothetical protein V7K27_27350 [Nostoc sp.]
MLCDLILDFAESCSIFGEGIVSAIASHPETDLSNPNQFQSVGLD